MAEYKTKKKILVAVAVLIGLLLVFSGFQAVKFVTYDKAAATVVSVKEDMRDNSGRNISIARIYVTYAYTVDGKTYTTEQKTWLVGGLEEGQPCQIRVNPKDPGKVFNPYTLKGTIMLTLFLSLFDALLFVVIRRDSGARERV